MSVAYKSVPIYVVAAPNDFTTLKDNTWVVTAGKADTLWLQLRKVDVLGERRFIIPTGATLQVIFPRAESVQHTTPGVINVTSQSIVKTATPHAEDRSMFSFNITSQEASSIIGGSVKFTLTVGSVVSTWLQNYTVRKQSADAAL